CDPIGERVETLVVTGVPLQRDLDLRALLRRLEAGHLLEQRLLRRVEVLHEVDDPALVLERLAVRVTGPLVTEADLEPLVEERVLLEPLEDGAAGELQL